MSPLTATAIIGVIAYYLIVWGYLGRDPKPGSIVPLYGPPRNFSPAMLRYVWKEAFDDRVFWASVLSLVSKGFATIESENGMAVLRCSTSPKSNLDLPDEERILGNDLLQGRRKGKRIHVTMLDGRTAVALAHMADTLRKAAAGQWFDENLEYVTVGSILSILALVVVAMPRNAGEFVTLGFSLALMAPGAFYLVFVVLRLRELIRIVQKKLEGDIVRRTLMLLALTVPCLASIIMGSVVLGVTWGWQVLAIAAFLVSLNLAFLRLMRAPTAKGRQLLDEIEGFRLFLKSVERLPMDRGDAPGDGEGLYERYLPYAVALEVEQAWCDRFVALASTFHQREPLLSAQSLYLGMWNGKPVDILYRAPKSIKG